MADVQELTKLSREKLNEFALQNGVENPEGFPNKEALAAEVSPRVTPEQLAEFQGTPAEETQNGVGGADENNPPEDAGGQEDPATDASHLEDVTDVAVDDHVYYPHKEAQSGYRRGRVTEIYDNEVEVVWADGSRRTFNKSLLKKA